jgi:ribosomal protein S1
MDIVSVGDIVKVKIIEFDKDRGRISFSMKGVN